jgi:uncharacterized SAM-binding protein YcdF (DUF218 family)
LSTARIPGGRARAGVGLAVGAVGGLIALDLSLPSLVSYWGDRTLLLPATAVLVAVLWMTPARAALGTAVAALGVLWLVVAYTPITEFLAHGLVRSDEVQAADVVFVFASNIQLDGDPGPDAMSRLLRGVELVADGRAPILVVSNLPPPDPPYTAIARNWVSRFAPQAEVLTVGPITNTHDEAVAVAALCRERGFSRVLAVSSPTHTRRAAATLEKQGLQVVSVPSIETNFDLERLERPDDRREAFGKLLHERVGLFVYRRRGWID